MVQKKTNKLKRYVKVPVLLLAIIAGALSVLLPACKSEKVVKHQPYDGPVLEMEDIETIYSDSTIMRVMLTAPLQYELKSGNREFPKGVDMDFFDDKGTKSSNLVSNYGHYDKEKKLYTVTGNVVIMNFEKGERLNTEELKWKPEEKKVFTDKFVRIETEDEILTGHGLESNEDFSKYKILKPSGNFYLKDE
ncbi:LPS export ABC transporter periplasmic protein LptC [Cytophagaceae bacterium ABcell3]|nr:LPS export ABC transporter periplasmic protein LptC [Cytophagaceae bacterium ABcell3]